MTPAPGNTASVNYPGLTALDYMEDESEFGRRKVRQVAPEKRLAAAVFAEVIEDLARGPGDNHESQKLYRATREWVASDATSWPYYFVSLCVELDLHVATTRDALLAIKPASNHRRGLIPIRPQGTSARPTVHRSKSVQPMWSWRYGDNRPGSRGHQ